MSDDGNLKNTKTRPQHSTNLNVCANLVINNAVGIGINR